MKAIKFKFVEIAAPDGTKLSFLPDSFPGEPYTFADFNLEYKDPNRSRKRDFRISISCIRVGSVLLKAVNTQQFAEKLEKDWISDHKGSTSERLTLNASRLSGKIIMSKSSKYNLFYIVARDKESVVSAIWKQAVYDKELGNQPYVDVVNLLKSITFTPLPKNK